MRFAPGRLLSAAALGALGACSGADSAGGGAHDSAVVDSAVVDSPSDSGDTALVVDCGTVREDAGVPFVNICASTFSMGCTEGQPDDCSPNEPVHTVTLTRDYWLAQTETTQAQFESVTGFNNAVHADCPTCPIEWVSWYEAALYANLVSADAGLEACYTCEGTGADFACVEAMDPYECAGYRLPTEAEWEGAARCGTDLVYSGSDSADEVGWYDDEPGTTHVVAGKLPNACGTYDQSGNVIEWTHDWYSELSTAEAVDPNNPADTADRVPRGGSYAQRDYFLRVSYRSRHNPVYQRELTGFRLARSNP
jgi:sulfatase modifying factor 1